MKQFIKDLFNDQNSINEKSLVGFIAFIMMIAGAVVLGSALITDAYYEPPLLVLAAIFLPLMLIVSLGLMRPAKGLLIASQYRNKAAQIINPD